MAVLNTGLATPATGDFTIDYSCRFEDGDSAYLSKTPAGAGNQKTWTWSGWVKQGNLGTTKVLFACGTSGDVSTYDAFRLGSDGVLLFLGADAVNSLLVTNQLFRDSSAWYHLILAVDTTQDAESDRMKMYVNGVQVTSFGTANYPSKDSDTNISSSIGHQLGARQTTGSVIEYLDGYLAEVHFIDGTALDHTSFGEAGDYGEWKAKEYDVADGAYGTNGFYLDFSDSAALGDDAAGSNDWTVNNLVASDQMLDSPTNNFATLNPINNQTAATLSEGNLKAVGTGANWDNITSSFAVSSGKWYWEVKAVSISESEAWVSGIHQTGFEAQSLGWYAGGYTAAGYGVNFGVQDNNKKATNASQGTFTSDIAAGDIVQFRLNLDDDELSVSVDGVDKGKLYDITAAIEYTPASSLYNTSSAIHNFGQDSSFAGTETAQGNQDSNGIGDFYYTPPTDYLALCTSNLPDVAVTPSEHFNTVLYTGDDSSDHQITGVGFQPDFTWIKPRSLADNHVLFDAVRGYDRQLKSNSTDAEDTHDPQRIVVLSDGFEIDSTDQNYNSSSYTYVAWNWKANGSGSANTDGTIETTVSANVDSGFSIIGYTGNLSADQTIGHGLSKAPEMYIIKNRTLAGGYFWHVQHKDLTINGAGGTNFILRLDDTAAAADDWEAPMGATSSVILLTDGINSSATNDDDAMICYAFHSVDGYSKVGSYTGNGNADGTFIYTGFRPAYVLIKRSNSSGQQAPIYDSARDTYNVAVHSIKSEDNAAEFTNQGTIDLLSNGFKTRDTEGSTNSSGGIYIYIAFAETPFKYSNAR